MTNIISFTISLEKVKEDKYIHTARRSISWVECRKYRKYRYAKRKYIREEALAIPYLNCFFDGYYVINGTSLIIYIVADETAIDAIYKAFRFHSVTLNHRTMTAYEFCDTVPKKAVKVC